jgi:ribosomal-protein-alanine N-acetyltransferase
MTNALDLIMQFAFGKLQLHRVYAIVHSRNTASIKVLERAGFVREGTWRETTLTDDRWHDVYAYGIIDHEFKR